MHWFVVPDLDGPVSGGTQYNRLLLEAAAELGLPCKALSHAAAPVAIASCAIADVFWVDSLFLDRFASLSAYTRAGTRIALLAHYLPSMVCSGDELHLEQLTLSERAALQTASLFLVPSQFMASVIRRLVENRSPILCVEPGRAFAEPKRVSDRPLRVLLVANLVPGKGVAPFLAALAEHVGLADEFILRVVGGFGFDPCYARRCIEIARSERLRGRVELVGELSPEDTLRAMAASNLLVSASRMESYGMALAEARALGLPIVARTGGNVANLVDAGAGGELVNNDAELALACLRLVREPAILRERSGQARGRCLPPRSWADAAQDFASQVATAVCMSAAELGSEGRAHGRSA